MFTYTYGVNKISDAYFYLILLINASASSTGESAFTAITSDTPRPN
jgi:hypothetical protein